MTKSSNINSLILQGLPPMSNISDFAREARLSKDTIYRLSKYSNYYYKIYEVPKKNGGSRTIAQPSRMLKGLQGWVLVKILNNLSPSSNCTAFRKGMNLLNNGLPHLGAIELLTIDIKDFFTSVKSARVFKLFKSIGYNNEVSNVLTKICCFKGSLPQGGPCSPSLANLTNSRLDRRIAKYCSKHSIIYTRYADDLTFSLPQINFSKQLTKVITQIIKDEGYVINDKKTRINGQGSQKKITGLVLSENSIGIGRKKYKILRAKIFKYGESGTINEEVHMHINGWLSFIKDVDITRYKNLKKYISKLIKDKKYKNLKGLN